tara:strand:- start:4287 stop:4517 length:231 start_codon:yes stop_codon:yes gene_type:complete
MNNVEFRGTVTVDGIIDLPEDWSGKIDVDTIHVQLTPRTVFQELFVHAMPYGKSVVVRNSGGGVINAYFTVTADLL